MLPPISKYLTKHKINLYIVYIIVFNIPLYIEYIPPFIILWAIFMFIEGGLIRKFKEVSTDKKIYFIASILFFILVPMGLLWTNNIKSGLSIVEEKLSLLAFPVLFLGANKLIIKNKINILKFFIWGNFFASIMCIIGALYKSISFEDGKMLFDAVVLKGNNYTFFNSIIYGGNYFFYTELSLFHHPTYFSAFLCMSLFFLYFILKNKEYNNNFFKRLYIFIFLFFIFIVVLLSSKAALIVLFIILAAGLILFVKNSKSKIIKFVSVFFLIILAIIIFINPRVKGTWNEITNYKKDKIPRYSVSARFVLWNNSLKLIKQNFIYGVGTGDVKDELMKELASDKRNKVITDKQLNCHNQYLETFVGHGVIGFLLLLFIMIYPLKIVRNDFRLLYIGFIIIVGVNFLFETMLNTFAGILFFTFFLNFYIFVNDNKSQIIEI